MKRVLKYIPTALLLLAIGLLLPAFVAKQREIRQQGKICHSNVIDTRKTKDYCFLESETMVGYDSNTDEITCVEIQIICG